MRSQKLVLSVLVTVGLGIGMELTLDCNSNGLVEIDSGSDATPACLTNVASQNGTACEAPDGYLCPTDFPCSPIAELADCVCTSGKWQCSYAAGDGGAIAPGTSPVCIGAGAGREDACPPSEAPGTTCTVAGLLCNYPGEMCDGGSSFLDTDASLPNTDTCQCVGGPEAGSDTGATVSLVFSCERALCNPTSDATIPPPPDDAGQPETGTKDVAVDRDAPADG
jgi:hypothetical protein